VRPAPGPRPRPASTGGAPGPGAPGPGAPPPLALGPALRRRTLLKGAAGLGLVGLGGGPLLAACSGGGRRAAPPGTLRLRSWAELGTPSPFGYSGGPGYFRMILLFDTLLWTDASGGLIPWLATTWEPSDDGLVHRLELRDGVTFADGQPLTAADVAFTYDYYTTRTFTPLLTGVPPGGAEVATEGDRVVSFRLSEPDATFPQKVLGTMPVVPRHIWTDIEDPMSASGPEAFLGSGPYRLAARDEAQRQEAYEARDDYFLGPPFIRRIETLPYEENLQSITALRQGELDGAESPVEGVRDEVLAPFRDNGTYGIIERRAGFAYPLFFNLTQGGPLADVRFRQACLHALDRDDMVQRILTGNGDVASAGFLPPTSEFHNPDVRAYPYDPGEAERLLDEAGFRRPSPGATRVGPDGAPLEFSFHLPDFTSVAVAELARANLGAVGIGIDIQVVDLIRLFGLKSQGTGFDLLLSTYPGPAGIALDADPDYLRSIYSSRPPSPLQAAIGYANAEVDQLLDAQRRTLDVAERKRQVNRVQELVAEDLPVAPLYYTSLFFVFRRASFDQWYYTPAGFGPGIPEVYNKQPYVTGRMTGTEVRARDAGPEQEGQP